jgi:hypothetical protein
MPAQGNRDIFAGNPPADNHLPALTQTPGGEDSLSNRQPQFIPPTSVKTDQGSPETARERNDLQGAYRDAAKAARAIRNDAGAGGTVVGIPSGFEQIGHIADADGAGPADVVAPEPPIITREGGGDDPRNSAYGKAI